MSSENETPRTGVGGDLILPVAGFAYAIYYVYSVWDFPPEAQVSGITLAALLMVLCIAFFTKIALKAVRGTTYLDFSEVLGPEDGRWRRFGFVLLIILYVFVVETGGFTLTTFGFILSGSLVAGLRPVRKALIFAAITALAGWLFFIVLLGTRFPAGPFENLVNAVTNGLI